jgi:hypothetical protein
MTGVVEAHYAMLGKVMRILILHRNNFERMAYEKAIDHRKHEVVYAGPEDYILAIPPDVRCERFIWEADGDAGVERQVRDWLRTQRPFDRVLARHEFHIMLAAHIRAEFGIAGMQPDVAVNFRDKIAMKNVLARHGFRVPAFFPAAEMPRNMPWTGRTIVKPRDGGGAVGVFLCPDYTSARDLVHKLHASDSSVMLRYEVEQFIDGPVWHVDGYVYQGVAITKQASRFIRTPLEYEWGLPHGSVQRDTPDLEDWAVDCVRALGGDSLTFHLEAIMTPIGPVFLEVAARAGGGYIAENLYKRTGVYVHPIDMATEVEGKLALRFIEKPGSTDFYGDFLYPAHIYRGARCAVIVPHEILNDPCLVDYRILSPEKTTAESMTCNPDHLPFAGQVQGSDPDRLEDWIRHLFAVSRVEMLREPSSASRDKWAVRF